MNNEQLKHQTGKIKHDRKLFLLPLLMLLIASQAFALLVSSGLINRVPEPVAVSEQAITLDDLKAVNDDLNEIRKSLHEINSNTELKDDLVEVEKVEVEKVEVKKVESKAAIVPAVPVETKPAAVVVKKDKENIESKQKITENKKIAVIEKSPAMVIPASVSNDEDYIQTVEKPFVEVNTVTNTKPAYIKYDIKGNSLEDNNEQWTCVQDTATGLMWEVKSESDVMRNSDNLYSWFDPEATATKGEQDGGRCKGDADCDTHAYIEAMNKQNYCGHNDWRLPTREEMLRLVSFGDGASKVKINTSYFPKTLPSWYWTASSNESRPEFAWYILFKNGMSLNDLKENPKHIRLVRSQSSS